MRENLYRKGLFLLTLSVLIFSTLLSNNTPVNAQTKVKQITKYRATIYEYSKPDWEKLADEILKPFGGIKKFPKKNTYGGVWALEVDSVLAKVPDFIERLNVLSKERLFSDDLVQTKNLVHDFYIEHYWEESKSGIIYVPHLEFKKYVELVRGYSTKKVDFSVIKEIKIYSPKIFTIKKEKGEKTFNLTLDKESFPKPHLTAMSYLAKVELLNGSTLTEAMDLVDKKLKGETDFGKFEMSLSYPNMKIVLQHPKDDTK